MKPCRDCGHEISEQAWSCPQCGAPYPAKETFDGWGYEYKSRTTILGMPLVHISFKYRIRSGGTAPFGFIGYPVPARGVIAIGQFACGIVSISQFGIGVFSLSQLTIAGFAVAQIAFAYSLIAQLGIYIHSGYGQLVRSLFDLL